MDERTRRIGENEALFREVNERIEEMSERHLPGRPLEVLCECGLSSCAQRVAVDGADYERVRAEPTWFLTVRGHERVDVERVVERREAWQIVEKREPGPAELARDTDPRG